MNSCIFVNLSLGHKMPQKLEYSSENCGSCGFNEIERFLLNALWFEDSNYSWQEIQINVSAPITCV